MLIRRYYGSVLYNNIIINAIKPLIKKRVIIINTYKYIIRNKYNIIKYNKLISKETQEERVI